MLRRLAIWLSALTAMAVALEVTVRLDDWAQFGVPLMAPAIDLEELSVRDSLGMHARAGTQFRQFHINALGFRGPEVTDRTDSTVLIMTAGASETFGLYESQGREWPRQLEDSLNACGARAVVLNAAFAGMALPTVQQDFVRRLASSKPRFVVYYPTPMQYMSGDPTAAEPATAAPVPLPMWRSRALPRFRDAFKRATPTPVLDLARRVTTHRTRTARGISVRDAVDASRLDAFERDLRGLIGTYRRGGATPVLLTHRNRFADTTGADAQLYLRAWERFYPEFTGAAIVRFDAQAALRVARVGSDSGVLVVDPLPALRAAGTKAFSDFAHFTDVGAAAVGGTTARALAANLCRR
ncbi:MAG TPA: hypothetical protein VGE27_12205 [Gemmatimonas sp.]|uniref:hypothetical protein n=1 Tax=Gemmatimonas sp. TaxID=1962908 RepID=UPI002EDB86B9